MMTALAFVASGLPAAPLDTGFSVTLELRVNGQRALRLEPHPGGAPNILGGSANNSVAIDSGGVTISGGKANVVESSSDYGTVGGGRENQIKSESDSALVSGGWGNCVETDADYTSIGGGIGNRIASEATYASIGGGGGNQAGAIGATIPGGRSAVAGQYGQWAYANGQFLEPGDAQTSLYLLRKTTRSELDQPPEELLLDGNARRLQVPTHAVWTFEVLMAAVEADDWGDALVLKVDLDHYPDNPPITVRWLACVRTVEIKMP